MPYMDVMGDYGTSSSVGDVFETEDGEFFFCGRYGFEKIENLTLEVA